MRERLSGRGREKRAEQTANGWGGEDHVYCYVRRRTEYCYRHSQVASQVRVGGWLRGVAGTTSGGVF